LGEDLFCHHAHLARFVLAASLLTLLSVGQSATAETLAQHSPVPQSLLLKFLADNKTFTLVDARSPAEFATSHIAGAINVPHDSSDDILSLLPTDSNELIVVYCKTGKRADKLRTKLMERGYTNIRVLLPEQIAWFDGMAVFNCGTPAVSQSNHTFKSLTIEEIREGKL
jgi:rhodanese-related sulfurtransferase